MIHALALDSMRVLLRGATAPLLTIVGVLLGLFVRATGTVEHSHLDTAPLSGGAIEILLSTLFGAALIYAVADGVRLANDDRARGLVIACSARPVSRVAFASGRILGLCLAQASGLAWFAFVAFLASGLPFEPQPTLRRIVEARVVTVGERTIEPGTEALIDANLAARFAFDGGESIQGQLRVAPRLFPGTKFSGQVAVRIDLERGGAVVESFATGPMRPHQPIPLLFRDSGAEAFTLVVRSESENCALAIEPENLFLLGDSVGIWLDASLCVLLTVFACWVLTSLAYALGLGLALGPAALAAGFVWLLAQARSAVLDLIAGIGAQAESAPGTGVLFARAVLSGLVRLAPDVSVFHHAARLGREQALADGAVVAGVLAALPLVLAALALAIAAVPYRER